MNNVKIGFAPTRRSIFSAPDAVKYANLTRERLKELDIDVVDITEFNDEGLLFCEQDMQKIEAQQQRPAPRVMMSHGNETIPAEPAVVRRDGDKVGRNDPCPCGSGKKYKRCHGK